MNDGRFQWDDEKAVSNYGKHRVRFEAARNVFKDPFAVELIDDRHDYGEDRFVLIGMAIGSLANRRLLPEGRDDPHHIGAWRRAV